MSTHCYKVKSPDILQGFLLIIRRLPFSERILHLASQHHLHVYQKTRKLSVLYIRLLVLSFTISTIGYGQQTLRFADSVKQAFHIPEICYAVVTADTVLEIAATGQHSINLADTATIDDRFHIGSNTKALTAFMIAKYVERGKLKWNTKLFDIFPEWKKVSNQVYRNITLQDLLSHRAGIQPFQGFDDPVIPTFKGSRVEKRKAFGKWVLALQPVLPDSANPFVYSNAGYTLAALMLEKVAGKTWELVADDIFNKDLKLSIGFSWPENQSQKDTWGHIFENGKFVPLPSNTDFSLDYTEPSSNINICIKDYIRYIQMNIAGLSGQNNYLKSSTYTFIHTGIPGYSLGWYNIQEGTESLSTHAGTATTYYTIAHIDRKRHLAYIIFTNAFDDTNIPQGVRLLMRELKKNYGK